MLEGGGLSGGVNAINLILVLGLVPTEVWGVVGAQFKVCLVAVC